MNFFTKQYTELLLSIDGGAGMVRKNGAAHGAMDDPCMETIAMLADAIEAKDPYTRGHCQSVATIAVRTGKHLGWTGPMLDPLRYAALLHDVGKIGIPDNILLKPERLLPEEFEVIQRHSRIGSDLVSRIASLRSIAPIILHHHERFDGRGYPHGLRGDGIPLAARIIGVVDALDAMTSPRPYRQAVNRSQALAELHRCAGSQFDPAVVAAVTSVVAEDTMSESIAA